MSFSFADLADLYRNGASVADVLRRSLACAQASADPAVWIHLATLEELLLEAERVEQRRAEGACQPLYGLPFAVKDNIDVGGWPTTAACPGYSIIANADAEVVRHLRQAGAIPVGKTNLDQFATGLVGTRTPYGACRNVFDAERISGGSSSGSAVAVALEQVAFALGTDTAGSGRIPAAFASLVGLKPTRGLWSTRGVVPACQSLDCVSVFARTCDETSAVWEVATGFDAQDPYSRAFPSAAPKGAPPQIRVAVPKLVPFLRDPAWMELWEKSLLHMDALGWRRVDMDFAPWAETARILYEGPWIAERWSAVGGFATIHPEALHPVTRHILESGAKRTASEVFTALHRLETLKRQSWQVFEHADVVALPTAGFLPSLKEVEADPFGPNSALGEGTNFCNLLDLSALAVPAGFDARGWPFGITLFGPAFHDRLLLELGSILKEGSQNMSTTNNSGPIKEEGRVQIAVAGLHLSGFGLNHELVDRGGKLERTTRTSAAYKAYRIVRGERRFPGLLRSPGGAPFEVEVWSLSPEGAGTFLAACVRPPLCLGTLELEDGTTCMGFLAEPHGVEGAEDISAFGSWRKAVS